VKIDLSGKTALITGGSRGLGLAMCERFAASGAEVVAIARNQAVLDEAMSKTSKQTGRTATGYVCDMAREESIRETWSKIKDAHGGIDILVNNAGTSTKGDFHELPASALRDDFELKVTGAMILSQLVLPHMKAQQWGRIINVLSIIAKAPPGGTAPTSMSRAAGMSMTKIMSKELAPDNILVNALCVGIIESDQWRRRYEAAENPGTYEEFLARNGAHLPLGRMGRSEEFAMTACFLASEAASYVSGVAINVDGGMCAVV
jgi:3-oxoacyl-[acyl-carrier protein] reductase